MIKPYFILPFFYSDINYVVRKAVLNVNFVHIPCFSCKYTCIAFIWHYIYITFYFGNGILLAVQLHIRVKSIKLIVARLFGGQTNSSCFVHNPWKSNCGHITLRLQISSFSLNANGVIDESSTQGLRGLSNNFRRVCGRVN